ASLRRSACVEHYEPRVVDAAVPVGKAVRQLAAQRVAGVVPPQIKRLRSWEALPLPEMVIEKQTGAQHQSRPASRHLRQHETLWPNDMSGVGKQHLALLQRLAHQTELEMLEIAQAAADELGARRRGGAAEVPLLDEQHRKSAPGSIRRDAGAVNAAAGNDEVVDHGGEISTRGLTATLPGCAA